MMLKRAYILFLLSVLLSPLVAHASEEGQKLAFSRSKGNCLACHAMKGGELPGNMGPALLFVKQRFPKRADLRAQIWDPTTRNPISSMPPFGKHRILSAEEIEKIMDFLYTL